MKSKITYLKKLELFKELDNYKDGHFFAIADQRAKNHLPQWIQFSPHVYWLKDPASERTLEVYGETLAFFLKQGIQKKSRFYAFGGGATTDLAGFVAATLLKGIPWMAVPTTLFAMVEASIGGKVAINMPQGNNLVGANHTPENIFICGDFLNTLSERDLLSGKGEILKYGFLSKDIYELILKKAPLEDIVLECAKFKLRVIEHDFKEQGERVFLSLGHTLGKAFEAALKIPSGQALGMGLKYLFMMMKQDDALIHWHKMIKALDIPEEKLSLEHYPHFDPITFFSSLEYDKKKLDMKLRLILVKSIGACYVEELTFKELKTKLQSLEEFYYQNLATRAVV